MDLRPQIGCHLYVTVIIIDFLENAKIGEKQYLSTLIGMNVGTFVDK